MNEYKEQSGNNKVESFSDNTIRLFLLGSLIEEERANFEAVLITNDSLEARVRLAELELADDYAFNRLNADERASFEKFFLVTDERKQKLTASRALQNYVVSQTAEKQNTTTHIETKPSLREKFLRFFNFKRPAFVFAVSFTALILFAGVVWLATRNLNNKNENIIVRHETPTPTPQPSRSTETIPTPTPDTISSPKPTPAQIDSTAPMVASFVLLPGSLRDEGEMTRITLPKGERDIVRLELTLESNEAGLYRIELLTGEGLQVLTLNRNGANSKVIFDIPANLLKIGDYQIKLSRVVKGEIEAVGRYSFRALQK